MARRRRAESYFFDGADTRFLVVDMGDRPLVAARVYFPPDVQDTAVESPRTAGGT